MNLTHSTWMVLHALVFCVCGFALDLWWTSAHFGNGVWEGVAGAAGAAALLVGNLRTMPALAGVAPGIAHSMPALPREAARERSANPGRNLLLTGVQCGERVLGWAVQGVVIVVASPLIAVATMSPRLFTAWDDYRTRLDDEEWERTRS